MARLCFRPTSRLKAAPSIASELAGPLRGEIGAYLDDLSAEENAHERSLEGPVYEVYIPLRSRRTNEIIAVGEFYESASVLRAQLSESFLSSLGVLGSVAVLILIALYLMVTVGTRTIDRQRREMRVLVDARESLANNNRTIAKDVETAKRNLFEIDRLFRRRVGLELHDGPSQLLSFVLMNLDEIAEIESPSATGAKSDVRDQIEKTKRAARDALGEIWSISRSLVALRDEESPQLAVPLTEAVRQFQDRTGWPVRCRDLELADDLPSDVHHGLVRVIIEAMNNSVRHSGAIELSVAVSRSDTHLSVVVSDNGKGMPSDAELSAAAKSGRMGLIGMRHRIENLGGTLSIESQAGVSTLVRIIIPAAPRNTTPG